MRRLLLSTALVLSAAIAASPALADSSVVELGRPDAGAAIAILAGGADCCPPPPPACGCEPEWKGKVWGSFSLTSGNTDTIAAVLGAEAIWKRDPWLFKAAVDFVYGENNGTTSAERWHAVLRGERKFSDRNYVFGQLTYDRDQPGGIDYRFIPTVGVGHIFFTSAQQELKGEVGGGMTIEKRVGLPETSDPSGYLALHYVRNWADKRAFHADAEFFPNFSDFDLSVARLNLLYEMPVSEKLRVTAGLRLDYVVSPPAGIDSLDTLFTIGFSANF